MTNHTVQSLRKAGFKVKVHSYRYSKVDGELIPRNEFMDTTLMTPKGGKVITYVKTPLGQEFVGESLCSPKDPFSRKVGIAIALGRVFSQIDNAPF